jgi:hypothetical protein
MRRRDASILALVLIATLSACATNPAPRRWLAPAREAATDPYGAWIVLHADARTELTRGELLAVAADSVFVLTEAGRVEGVARAAIDHATIAYYDSEWHKTAWWAAAGTLSTLSHGFGLVFTAPAWILSGTLAARADSRAPLIAVNSPERWAQAHTYARFPGGLPDGLPNVLPVKPRRQP